MSLKPFKIIISNGQNQQNQQNRPVGMHNSISQNTLYSEAAL
jgi:hypothetical protein